MKIKRLSVDGFRGLWEYDTDFNPGKAFILYGLNGTGKTSLYQSVRFVVTGDLPEVPHSQVSKDEIFRHAALNKSASAVVQIELSDGGNVETIRRGLQRDGSITDNLSSSDLEELSDHEETNLCFLDQRKFSRMIEAAERDRWEHLSPLLGHERLGNYREGIRLISLSLKSDFSVRRFEDEAEQLEATVDRLRDRYVERRDELGLEEFSTESLSKELLSLLRQGAVEARNEAEGLESVEDIDGLDWSIVNDGLGGSQKLAEMNERLSSLNRREDLNGFEVDPDGHLSALVDLLARLDEDPEVGHQILHAEFFQRARTVVSDYVDEPCPVCGLTPADWDAVRDDLDEKAGELRQIAKQRDRIEQEGRREFASIKSVVTEYEDFQEEHELTESEEQILNKARKYRDLLERAVGNVASSPAEGLEREERKTLQESAVELSKVREEVQATVTGERQSLADEIEELSEQPHRVRFANLQTLSETFLRLTERVERYQYVKAWLREAEKLIDGVQRFKTTVSNAEGRLSADVLKKVESRVEDIFQQITNNKRLTPSIDRIEERGVVKADITVEDFYGLGERSAREYLSESNRNALGLAIYFAAMEYRSPPLEAIVMDDITHSTDIRHRRGLSNFVRDDLATQWQVVLFTHDKEWFERLKNLFKDEAEYRKVLEWNIKGVKTKSDEWMPLRERARKKIQNQELGAGTTLRMAIEEFIDKVCERHHIRVGFRRQADQVRFEEKRDQLVQKLEEVAKQGRPIIDPQSNAVRNFQTSQYVANLASHQPTQKRLSGTARQEALRDFEAFSNLFICENKVRGERCGWMLDKLQHPASGHLECRKCHQPFGTS